MKRILSLILLILILPYYIALLFFFLIVGFIQGKRQIWEHENL